MEVIIFVAILFVICVCAGQSNESDNRPNHPPYGHPFQNDTFHSTKSKTKKKKSHYDFEEDDSFYDRDGIEHIVDDDRYCEDCDDYHDHY